TEHKGHKGHKEETPTGSSASSTSIGSIRPPTRNERDTPSLYTGCRSAKASAERLSVAALVAYSRAGAIRSRPSLWEGRRVPHIPFRVRDLVLPSASRDWMGTPLLGPRVHAVGAHRLQRVRNRHHHLVLVHHLRHRLRVRLQVADVVHAEDLDRRARNPEQGGLQRRGPGGLGAGQAPSLPAPPCPRPGPECP